VSSVGLISIGALDNKIIIAVASDEDFDRKWVGTFNLTEIII
jgi:hypothetical protein